MARSGRWIYSVIQRQGHTCRLESKTVNLGASAKCRSCPKRHYRTIEGFDGASNPAVNHVSPRLSSKQQALGSGPTPLPFRMSAHTRLCSCLVKLDSPRISASTRLPLGWFSSDTPENAPSFRRAARVSCVCSFGKHRWRRPFRKVQGGGRRDATLAVLSVERERYVTSFIICCDHLRA